MIQRTRHLPARLHRQRKRARRFDHGQPISRIDTRPMAVLATCLIAFSIAFFKVQPHAFEVNLWNGADAHPLILNSEARTEALSAPINRVVLTESDSILWNGQTIAFAQLPILLRETGKLEPQPVIELEPDANAGYDLSAKVLYLLTNSGVEFRISDLEKHCRFDSEYSYYGHSGGSLGLAMDLVVPKKATWPPRGNGDTEPLFNIETCDPRFVVHRPR